MLVPRTEVDTSQSEGFFWRAKMEWHEVRRVAQVCFKRLYVAVLESQILRVSFRELKLRTPLSHLTVEVCRDAELRIPSITTAIGLHVAPRF